MPQMDSCTFLSYGGMREKSDIESLIPGRLIAARVNNLGLTNGSVQSHLQE